MSKEVGAKGFINEQTAMIARPDSRHMLADIDVPTVVIVGRQDQATPLPRSQPAKTISSRPGGRSPRR